MRVEVHVKTAADIAAARADAEPHLSEGDELVVIVARPTAGISTARTQERKPAR